MMDQRLRDCYVMRLGVEVWSRSKSWTSYCSFFWGTQRPSAAKVLALVVDVAIPSAMVSSLASI